MAKKILYAAYGSNMNLEQMSRRCPAAKIFAKGTVKGYELEFRGMSSWGGGVATITPVTESEVPVLLWELTEECEKSLDIYEGYPNFYEKERVWATLENGRRRKCMAYIMTEGREISLPSKAYFAGIADGYKSAGIPLNPLYDALDKTFTKSSPVKTGR